MNEAKSLNDVQAYILASPKLTKNEQEVAKILELTNKLRVVFYQRIIDELAYDEDNKLRFGLGLKEVYFYICKVFMLYAEKKAQKTTIKNFKGSRFEEEKLAQSYYYTQLLKELQ